MPWLGEQSRTFLSALPLLAGHLVLGTLVWAVVLRGSSRQTGACQKGHRRLTGLSSELSESIQHRCGRQAHKTSSLTLC